MNKDQIKNLTEYLEASNIKVNIQQGPPIEYIISSGVYSGFGRPTFDEALISFIETLHDKHFSPGEHMDRWHEMLLRLGKSDDEGIINDNKYAAVLYLLIANPLLWGKVESFLRPDGIDFEAIMQDVDLSKDERIMVRLAANLFSQTRYHIDPVELLELDDQNFEIAIITCRVRRESLRFDDLKQPGSCTDVSQKHSSESA